MLSQVLNAPVSTKTDAAADHQGDDDDDDDEGTHVWRQKDVAINPSWLEVSSATTPHRHRWQRLIGRRRQRIEQTQQLTGCRLLRVLWRGVSPTQQIMLGLINCLVWSKDVPRDKTFHSYIKHICLFSYAISNTTGTKQSTEQCQLNKYHGHGSLSSKVHTYYMFDNTTSYLWHL